jgi:hypothetical protein
MYEYLTFLSAALRSGGNVDDIADSISETQYRSKKWLVDTLLKQELPANPTILILGGWYGSYLIPLLQNAVNPSHIYFNDINPSTIKTAEIVHRQNKNITFHVFDVFDHKEKFHVDLIINTSCEHMDAIGDHLTDNPKCLYVLQTCDNKNDPGHVNTSQSTDEFVKKAGLSTIAFRGRLSLGHKNRFMVIGYK